MCGIKSIFLLLQVPSFLVLLLEHVTDLTSGVGGFAVQYSLVPPHPVTLWKSLHGCSKSAVLLGGVCGSAHCLPHQRGPLLRLMFTSRLGAAQALKAAVLAVARRLGLRGLRAAIAWARVAALGSLGGCVRTEEMKCAAAPQVSRTKPCWPHKPVEHEHQLNMSDVQRCCFSGSDRWGAHASGDAVQFLDVSELATSAELFTR